MLFNPCFLCYSTHGRKKGQCQGKTKILIIDLFITRWGKKADLWCSFHVSCLGATAHVIEREASRNNWLKSITRRGRLWRQKNISYILFHGFGSAKGCNNNLTTWSIIFTQHEPSWACESSQRNEFMVTLLPQGLTSKESPLHYKITSMSVLWQTTTTLTG